MRRKVISFGLALFLLSLSILGNACAEASVGVSKGDTFTYNFIAYFWSENPRATVPDIMLLYNMTLWVRFTIADVTNLNVSYTVMGHLLNGTENNHASSADLGTGVFGFPIIGANLGVNDPLYPSYLPSASAPKVDQTLNRVYKQSQRPMVHATWNDTRNHYNAYFDQKTGMPVELHVYFTASADGSAELIYELADSNVWTVPEFPTAFVVPLLAAFTLSGALVYKKASRKREPSRDAVVCGV
jgi:hypothetical protein